MRAITTGLAEDGRSTIMAIREIPANEQSEGHAAVAATIARSDGRSAGEPRTAPSGPGIQLAPGESRWVVYHLGPNCSFPTHQTHTIDHDTVLAGEIELELEDGSAVQLEAGDSALVPGVAHAWRAGLDGCTLMTVCIGMAS